MKAGRKFLVSSALALFVLTFLSTAALAATLYMQSINYQGRLAESGGAPVNGPLNMTYEGHEPIQTNTAFTADMKTAEEFERTYAKEGPVRDLLVSNGILTADGKLNMELAKELGWVVKDSDVAAK